MTLKSEEPFPTEDAEHTSDESARLRAAQERAARVKERLQNEGDRRAGDLEPQLESHLPALSADALDASETEEGTADPGAHPDKADPSRLPRIHLRAGIIALGAGVNAIAAILLAEDGLLPSGLLALALAAGMVWRASAPPTDEQPTGLHGMVVAKMEKLWASEAASFYGIGTLATFLQLEARTLLGDLADAGGLIEFLTGEIGEHVIGFSMRSLSNSISAAMWPIDIITGWTMFGALALGLGFAAWDRVHDRVDDMLRARDGGGVEGGARVEGVEG